MFAHTIIKTVFFQNSFLQTGTTTGTNNLTATALYSHFTNGGTEHGPFRLNVIQRLLQWQPLNLVMDTSGKESRQAEGVLSSLVSLSDSGGSGQILAGQVECGFGSCGNKNIVGGVW